MRLYPKDSTVPRRKNPAGRRPANRRVDPSNRPIRWWKSPAWWQVIAAFLALLLAAAAFYYTMVSSAPLKRVQIHTVPAEWYNDPPHELYGVRIEGHDAQLENVKFVDSIEYLRKTPLVLDILNLTQPPTSFRLIADSLETLIQAGLVVQPEMLLRLGNASFAIGDYERAERFYWRVPHGDQYSKYFEIAVQNCGVVNGVFGDDEGRKQLLDYVSLYSEAEL